MPIARPLRLRPSAVPKVWGGDALRRFVSEGDREQMDWPADQPVGEVWLVSDRAERSSVVVDGPFAGRTLHGLMLSERDALLGNGITGEDDSFPLLLKLIDARKNLSIQVHPDEAAARALGSLPKGECWYLLDADPGAEVYLGLAEGVDGTRFALGAATPDVVDLLQRYPVHAGDGVDVSPGVVHGIGAGVVIAEVQNNSDTTYRLYDWDRVGMDGERRPTHLDEALRSIDFDARPAPPGPIRFEDVDRGRGSVNRRAPLRYGQRFDAAIVDIHDPVEIATPGIPTAILVLEGRGRIETNTGEDASFSLETGSAWVLPADLESARIVDADGDLRLLRARPAIQED